MNSRTFYNLCRELVLVYWRLRFDPKGGLMLISRFVEAGIDDLPPLRPIAAVATYVYGFDVRRYYQNSVLTPAKKLGLSDEFANLVNLASDSREFRSGDVQDVREKMLKSLTLGRCYKSLSFDDLRQKGFMPTFVDDDGGEEWKGQ